LLSDFDLSKHPYCGNLITIRRQRWSAKIEILEAEALQLTPGDRARLIERLISSLDIDPVVEEAWAAEVERRNAEIENGIMSLLPGPETLAKLKAEFE
jgi:putative addiction module component (TIGR02574 family)